MTTKTPLYHYTCEHGHADIEKAGGILKSSALLVDNPRADPLLWLTDIDWPFRDALGLTMDMISCDRTKFRYRIDNTEHIHPWLEFRKEMRPEYVWPLELAPGVTPGNWFVTTLPTFAIYDPVEDRRKIAP